MAQIKYSANLAAADFTFSFSYKGPSVMIAAGDQNYFQATADWAGQTPQRGINIPQVMYCENTVPTAEGYRSVAYKWFVEPALPLTQRFVKYFSIFEGTGASALLGVTADKKIYVLSAQTSGEWTLVTWNDTEFGPIAGTWDAGAQITWTTADIFSLIHIAGYGTFAFNYLANSLVYLPLTGLDDTKLNGICASSGYLVAWDDTTIYWSSTEHILDFVPSLITGAGSAKVAGLKGNIKLCKEIGGGFIIYSDVTVLSAAYSSNSAIPFIFDVLAGGAGIRHADHVTADINTQVHFVWSTSGLLGVELHQVKTMFPQLTDFIASGISDSSTTDGYPTVNWLDDYKEVRLAIVSGRYLCVSFGVENTALSGEYPTHDLSQSLVYDMQLRRWGKLNVTHVQIIEAPFVAREQVFFLVSHLYPIEVTEKLKSQLSLPGAKFLPFADIAVDKTTTSFGLTGLQLRELIVYGYSTENISTNYNLTGLLLKELIEYGYATENVTTEYELTNLQLKDIIIQYQRYADEIQATFSVTGMQLL